MKPRILLLSAYDANSHRIWRQRLLQLFPEYDWTCLTLSPRNFNWRIRGNSLIWGLTEADLLAQDYKLLLATSMVDLASLRGFVPALVKVPAIVYFHENQFVYPQHQQRQLNVEPQLVPLYAALCADRIVFNSNYNRDSFLKGASSLFKKLPDQIPAEAMDRLRRSQVIPVPVPQPLQVHPSTSINKDILEVVWNHRWEYDKGIERLLELVKQVHRLRLPLRLHIVGEQFRQIPPAFSEIDSLLMQHAQLLNMQRGKFGFIAAQPDYQQLLANCDVVLSTALHDFQGLAMQEAILAGCTPLAPAALVYPEYLDASCLYPLSASEPETAANACARLQRWLGDKAAGRELPKPALSNYRQEVVQRQYAELFEGLWRAH